ncbi:MAG: D-aminoacyl-tRNA deacylase [Oligoflexus sp.]
MRAVIQRVVEAKVHTDQIDTEHLSGAIKQGYLVYLGVGKTDGPQDEDYITDKICHLRLFPDEQGRFDRSLTDIGGEVLLVSQFTLFGDARKGRRPSFSEAAPPELASQIYENVRDKLITKGIRLACGVFQAHMLVSSINDGPVTILLDSKKIM